MDGLGTRQYTTFSKTRQFQVPACWLAESVWVSEQLLAALVHCYGRPNQHDCVMSRQRSGYLFWVCVGGFCRPYWSWLAQPMLWAVQQPVLIRWAQSLSCSFPLLVLLPLHLAARPNCPCLVVVSDLLLYLASGASFWSWDKGVSVLCLKADPGHVSPHPSSPPEPLQLYFVWWLKTAGTEKRTRTQQRTSSVHPARSKKISPSLLIFQGHSVL